jgi:hypothetical protein
MQTTASTLALKDSSFSKQVMKPEKQFAPGGFFQQIVSSLNKSIFNKDLLDGLGGKLVALADYTFTPRQIELVEEASHILLKPPRALVLYNEEGRAVSLIERFDTLTTADVLRVIAGLNDTRGYYQGALTDLGNLLPLACAVSSQNPCPRHSYLSAFAARMCEMGRIEVALRPPEITLASPYASAYAELHETCKYITQKQYRTHRSFVAINQSSIQKENVLHLPVPGRNLGLAMPATERAKVLYYADWKNKMGKEPNGNEIDVKSAQDMTGKEMIYRIINLFTDPNTSEAKRLEMIQAVERIASRPDPQSIKDSDKD